MYDNKGDPIKLPVGHDASWMLRIVTVGCIMTLIAVATVSIKKAVSFYIYRWSALSLRVLATSFAVLLALGGEIRQATDINLLLPFILTQAIFLRVLQYCDKRYCHWYDADRWQQVQNQSDDSFFLITRLMRREDKEHAD